MLFFSFNVCYEVMRIDFFLTMNCCHALAEEWQKENSQRINLKHFTVMKCILVKKK